MKEQNKTPEKQLNKMVTSNLLDAKLKTLVIRMFNELNENLNSIKKDQSEMKDTLTEKKFKKLRFLQYEAPYAILSS